MTATEIARQQGTIDRMLATATEARRVRVITAARQWIDTRFHHGAQVKGAGVDCVHFPAASFNEGLGLQILVHDYSPQWHLHQTGADGQFEELYLRGLIAQGFVEISDGRTEEPFDPNHFVDAPKGMGDLVISRLARTYCHGAIIIEWPHVIQAESTMPGRGCVTLARTDANWYFTSRPLKFFSRKEWH